MPDILTVIPARSGSKSLPHKNIKLLEGKPLLAYSIEYAKRCALVSKTVVSTDSEEYADIARQYGASVPFLRPPEYARDSSTDFEFMKHAFDFHRSHNEHYDLLVLLRPTSPLRPKGLIERGLSILCENPSATSVRSVAPVTEHPYRVWSKRKDGSIEGFVSHEKEPYNLPRQKLPELLFQTGDIEIVRASTLLTGSVSGDNVYPLIIAHDDMVDIDSESDFKEAKRRML